MAVVDTGAPGRAHGGAILRLCDEAAGIAASKHARCRVVTAGVDRVSFLEPVYIGELLTLRARVNAVWRTSAEIGVRVCAEGLMTDDSRHVLSAYFTMVALDEDGAPAAMPGLAADSASAVRREHEANVRRQGRLAERRVLLAAYGADGRLADDGLIN
jgi:acyl-CoA hydrolase